MPVPRPIVEVDRDYDGYFEALVTRWIDEKAAEGGEFRSARIVVSAGPYRPHAVETCGGADGTLFMDFYSALRAGFGSLSDDAVRKIKALL